MPLGDIFTDNGITYYQCSSCNVNHTVGTAAENCCTYRCLNCGARYTYEDQAEECCTFECGGCGASHMSEMEAADCCSEREYDEDEEIYDVDYVGGEYEAPEPPPPLYPSEVLETVPEHLLYVQELPDRPPRLCSIEQELCSGGSAVAKMFYELELSEYDRVVNYGRDGNARWILVKEDGSLPRSGGEVVYSRFNLNAREDVDRLSKGVACIKALADLGITSDGFRAGTHIHLGALDLGSGLVFGPAQMAALYEIFSFTEEVLFRIAAVGSVEHRGGQYSQRLPKIDKISAGKVAQHTRRSRYFSLNFARLLTAATECTCGACVAGDWQECGCGTLQRGTIEWRIFNATTNPHTLHAWAILAHALTAAAFTHELGTLEPNSYQETRSERHAWLLGWILQNCPLTNPERQIIIEAAKRAPGLQIDWDDFHLHHGGWGQLEIPVSSSFEAPPRRDDLAASFDRVRRASINWAEVASQLRTQIPRVEDPPF